MNDDRITSLVSELIAFDGTLKEHETDLRVLVSHMVSEKPGVTLDDTFVSELRARLLSGHLRAVLSPYQKAERWAFRLVPLGMVALLVLMLLPERTHYIPVSETTNDTGTRTEMVDRNTSIEKPGLGEGSGVTERSVPTDAPAFSGGDDMGTMESFDASTPAESDMAPKMMTMETPPTVPAPFTIDPQPEGPRVMIREATVTTSSFIVIYTHDRNGNEVVFGVSPLLRPGSTKKVPIYTHTPTRAEGTYYAMLHEDNGNRLFTKTEDMPLTDGYGNPLQVPLSSIPSRILRTGVTFV